MKKIFAAFLSLGLVLISCTLPQQTATPLPNTLTPTATTSTSPLQTDWDDRSIFEDGLIASERSVLTELKGASVYHIEFNIADDLYHVTGHQEVRYVNNESDALREIQFRLFPNILGGEMTVSNLTIDGQSVTPKYRLENSLLILPFESRLEPGSQAVIAMDFAVTIPQSVELNYGVLAYYEDVLTLAHAYPMIAVYDDEGWNAEIPPQSGDVTYADTSFYIVKINAPADLTLVATGREIQRDEAGQTQTFYVANGPARDFYLVASPAYEEISETFGEVTIRSYARDGSEEGARLAMDVAAKSVAVFSERYVPYPYTEFDIVATPTLALGIEYPGMVAIASRIYDVSDSSTGTTMEFTVAHEVGHQWFYALVGDDQLDDPWLDESLTQFITLQYYEDEYGPQAAESFRSSLEGRWAQVGRAEIPIGLPVADYTGGEYSAIVYGRGPLFFVALKQNMGTDKFDAFLRDYTESLSWGIATPESLYSMAEKHCGCELDVIFNRWVFPK